MCRCLRAWLARLRARFCGVRLRVPVQTIVRVRDR